MTRTGDERPAAGRVGTDGGSRLDAAPRRCRAPFGLPNPKLAARLRAAAGRRLLVLGNHDSDLHALAEAGFATQHRQALYEAEPTLALTHEPLTAVPVGAVNVHGHLHEGTETRRHVNVAVERWNYEPVPTAAVAARALERWK